MRLAGGRPARTGLFLDFDGTLAAIVDHPEAARPDPRVPELLAGLARRWGRVAVVSGRPAAFLLEHLAPGPEGPELLGLYGLERVRPGTVGVVTAAGAEPWREVVEAAAEEAEQRLPAGVRVERKGLTVTLHFRSAPSAAPAVERLAAAVASRTGLSAHGGKMSVELRPPIEVDKGTVVRELADGLDAVLFAGDDLGDLPAFSVMAQLRAAGLATLSIASGGAETPPEVLAAADVVVEGPAGLVELLDRLAATGPFPAGPARS